MILGLVAPAQSGKDTVAKSLKLRGGFERVAFADRLKDVAYDLDPLLLDENRETGVYLADLIEDVGWDEAKTSYPAVRQYLQRLGVVLREQIDPLIWVKAAGSQIMAHVEDGKNVVVTDVRFPNEVDFLAQLGASFVRIRRPGVGPVNGHESDNALSGFVADYELNNNGTINQLGGKVTEMPAHFGVLS